MLKRLVIYFLGPWGMKALFFYIEHSIWFNSVVFIYALLLLISYLNYKRILEKAIEIIYSEIEKYPKKKNIKIAWENINHEVAFIPFVANKLSFFPKRIEKVVIENMINKEKEIIEMKKKIILT